MIAEQWSVAEASLGWRVGRESSNYPTSCLQTTTDRGLGRGREAHDLRRWVSTLVAVSLTTQMLPLLFLLASPYLQLWGLMQAFPFSLNPFHWLGPQPPNHAPPAWTRVLPSLKSLRGNVPGKVIITVISSRVVKEIRSGTKSMAGDHSRVGLQRQCNGSVYFQTLCLARGKDK